MHVISRPCRADLEPDSAMGRRCRVATDSSRIVAFTLIPHLRQYATRDTLHRHPLIGDDRSERHIREPCYRQQPRSPSPIRFNTPMSVLPSPQPDTAMQGSGPRRSARIAAKSSVPSTIINPDGARRIVELSDLPTEIIDLIGHHLRAMASTCRSGKKLCARDHVEVMRQDLSAIAADTYSDASWALSCTSKRYRAVLFDQLLNRKSAMGYCVDCYTKARLIDPAIRANVRYAPLERRMLHRELISCIYQLTAIFEYKSTSTNTILLVRSVCVVIRIRAASARP
jgi:hypothetical protein